MATIPSRQSTLERVLDSLTGQLDELFLALNYGNVEAPKFLDKYKNIYWWHNSVNKGCSEKMAMAHIPNVYYVSWDDDLIACDGIINRLVKGAEEYKGLVSFHGRKYEVPITSFKKWSKNYRCLDNLDGDRADVNFIGSGCACFNTNLLKINLSQFHYPNMTDCYLSRIAYQSGLPMVVLAHAKGDLIYTNPEVTIWNSMREYTHQTFILQSYIK
jgi:hypothetical protein